MFNVPVYLDIHLEYGKWMTLTNVDIVFNKDDYGKLPRVNT